MAGCGRAAWSALLIGTATIGARQASDAVALAERIQQHYDNVRDFRADFMHGYEGGVLRKRTVDDGTVAIRKPGRMRWVYTKPEEKTFVSDGLKLYSYIPADKQVYVASVPQRRPGLDAGAVPGRQGQSGARLHGRPCTRSRIRPPAPPLSSLRRESRSASMSGWSLWWTERRSSSGCWSLAMLRAASRRLPSPN